MKYSLLLLFALIITWNHLSAQTGDTLFYDGDWNLCSPASAFYYGIAHIDSLGNGQEISYYITGEKQSIVVFERGLRSGVCEWWYRNGQRWAIGSYRSNLAHGRFEYWYDNGTKSEEGLYLNGEEAGEWQRWDRDGKRYYDWDEFNISLPLWGEQKNIYQSLALLGEIVSDDLPYPIAVKVTPYGETPGSVFLQLSAIVYTDGTLKVMTVEGELPTVVMTTITQLLEEQDGWTPGEKDGLPVNMRVFITVNIEEQ